MKKKIILLTTIFLAIFQGYAFGVEPYINAQLLEAASMGDVEAVENALHNGAQIDATDRLGNTALLLAADGGYGEVAKVLIKNKASINVVNNFDYTPLMTAVTNGSRHIVALLVGAGADVKQANKYGTTPEMYIRAQGFSSIDDYLKDENFLLSTDNKQDKRGAMVAIHSSPWKEKYNKLVAQGKKSEATDYLLSYANAKHPEACYILGELYLSEGNKEQGILWLKQAGELGDSMIKYRVAKTIIDRAILLNLRDAINLLKSSMSEGNNLAKVEYGKALLFGYGVPKDNANAYALFKEVTTFNIPEAIYYAGILEYLGRGVLKNEENGIINIQKSADMGFHEAVLFIDRFNAKKHMDLLVSSRAGDRAAVRTYLADLGVTINTDDPDCDAYTIGNSWNNAYKISNIKMCYNGNNQIEVKFIFSKDVDNIEYVYLQNLYPTVKFTMPSVSFDTNKNLNNKQIEVSSSDNNLSSNKYYSYNISTNLE